MPLEFAVFSWLHRNFSPFFVLMIWSLCFVCLGLNFKVRENYVSCCLNFDLASPEIANPYLFSDMEIYCSSKIFKKLGEQNTLLYGL